MKMLCVTQQDGSKWAVPVAIIAANRAKHYASEFDGSAKRSLDEDTLPLFASDDYAVEDWAANNMNWSDFAGHQVKIKDADPPDFQEAWVSGDKDIIDWKFNVSIHARDQAKQLGGGYLSPEPDYPPEVGGFQPEITSDETS